MNHGTDSLLQQMVLLKDSGFSVVCGPTSGGLVWPNLVGDMIFQQALASARYKKVIVLSFDRSLDELRISLGANDANRNNAEKLVLIEASSVLVGKKSLDSVLEEVRRAAETMCNAAESVEE